MTDVKICGLTRSADVEKACALGASYVGFIFAEASPRRVSLQEASELGRATRPGVARVGIFVHEDYAFIGRAVEAARLDLAQIHRPLRPEDLDNVPVPIVAVARVAGGVAQVPALQELARCRSILFDAAGRESGGGSGVRFDWTLLAGKTFPVPVFLGGGLDAGNVGEAIARVKPAAVDVASGVESAPGIKDEMKMKRFFEEVHRADARWEAAASSSPSGKTSA